MKGVSFSLIVLSSALALCGQSKTVVVNIGHDQYPTLVSPKALSDVKAYSEKADIKEVSKDEYDRLLKHQKLEVLKVSVETQKSEFRLPRVWVKGSTSPSARLKGQLVVYRDIAPKRVKGLDHRSLCVVSSAQVDWETVLKTGYIDVSYDQMKNEYGGLIEDLLPESGDYVLEVRYWKIGQEEAPMVKRLNFFWQPE